MEYIRIRVVGGERIRVPSGHMVWSTNVDGSIQLQVDAYLRTGWRVVWMNKQGQILVEKGENQRLLGDPKDVEEQEIAEEESYPQIAA